MTDTHEYEGVDLPADVAAEVLRLLDAPDPLAALFGESRSVGAEAAVAAEICDGVRGLLDGWAALPIALEPSSPSAATRERLLAHVRAEGAQRAPQPLDPSATPTPARAPGRGEGRRGARPASRFDRASPWLLPLAATLVVALLAVSAGLWARLDEQNRRMARLTQRVEELSAAPATSTVQARLDAMEEHLRVVSTPGVEVCPLRLRAAEVTHSAARGILYVAPDHQHWYLALSGLRPAPEGRSYHLWFFVDGRPVSAGAFEARSGEIIRLGSDTMPEGTQAVGITLEPRKEMERPSGEPILFGDEVMRVT